MAKERKSRQPTNVPYKEVISNNLGMEKRWKSAQVRPPGAIEGDKNYTVELLYKKILVLAKTLHLASGNTTPQLVFERCYREDNTENSFTMHSFITPSFYWYLECDFAFYYMINYHFYDCLYEEQIMSAISGWLKYIPTRVMHTELKPSGLGFYKKVLMVQDRQYIYLLTDNLKQSS